MPEPIKNPSVQASNYSIAVSNLSVGGSIGGNLHIGNINGLTEDEAARLFNEILAKVEKKDFSGECPYKGLDSFDEADTDLFFGRETLVGELSSRVDKSRTVFITGASGSGKSSLVRAGLIPSLKKSAKSRAWRYAAMRPGREPFKALAAALSRLKMDVGDYFLKNAEASDILHRCAEALLSDNTQQRLVLFIDQFEEIFTQVSDDGKRQTFLNLLTEAAGVENGRVVILFTMRSDFVPNCARYPKLNDLLNKEFIQIGAMQPAELIQAISLPALHVGLEIEPGLVTQIINEMDGEPGALPLMQFALKDLFDAQQAAGELKSLTLAAYLKRGGIHKALERYADATLAGLDANEQALTRTIFSGLIEIGRGTQDTKRTANFSELTPASAEEAAVNALLQKLASARLVTTDKIGDDTTVTLSHEKLIDSWGWLRKLVDENRDVIALQNEIAEDAAEWNANQRDTSYLYTGVRLANATEKLQNQNLALSGISLAYVRAGQARQRRNRRILVAAVLGLILLLVLASGIFFNQSQENARIASTAQAASTLAVENAQQAEAASTLAFENAEEAEAQAKIARAGELAAQSELLIDRNLPVSLLLGVEGFRLLDTPQTRGALLDSVGSNWRTNQFINTEKYATSCAVFTPDGKTLATCVNQENTIILADVATGSPLGSPLVGHQDTITFLDICPDGKTLASASWDGTIILWDLKSGAQIGEPLSLNPTCEFNAVAFSPQGDLLAARCGDDHGTISLWDVASRKLIAEPFDGQAYYPSAAIRFSPDGKTLAAESYAGIMLWEIATQEPIRELEYDLNGYVTDMDFSPNGDIIAVSSDTRAIFISDVASGEQVATLTGHSHAYIESVTFSPDGKILVSTDWDDAIVLWDMDSFEPIGDPLTGHKNLVEKVNFNPESGLMASVDANNGLILWQLEAAQNPILKTISGHSTWTYAIALSPDGRRLAFPGDESILLWDTSPLGLSAEILTGELENNGVAFSSDGKTLASSGFFNPNIYLWDVETRQSVGTPLKGQHGAINQMAFHPDGQILASGSHDGTIILWDVKTRQPIGQPLLGHHSSIYNLLFSPDGKTLVSSSADQTIIFWDVATGQQIDAALTAYSPLINKIAFSPDGSKLAVGKGDNAIVLIDVSDKTNVEQIIAHTAYILSIAFSPDGKRLALLNADNTLLLWDIATQQSIGQPVTGYRYDAKNSLRFHQDGKTLFASTDEIGGTIMVWDIDPASWIAQACQRAGRNLTRAEWAQFGFTEPYRVTCEQWRAED